MTKHFFWTVHTQLFNILTPLLCLYVGLHFSKFNPFRKLLKLSFFSGLSTLIYGNFLLLLPTIIFCCLYAMKKQGKWNVKQVLVKPGLLTMVFFLPSVAWILILYSSGVHFFSSEIATLRQFVWITDELARSDFFSFIAAFYENTLEFATTFGSIIFTTVFLLITVPLVKRNNVTGPDSKNHVKYSDFRSITILVFILTFTFFWLLGYYADRLTFSLAPVLLFYTAAYMNRYTIGRSLKYLFNINNDPMAFLQRFF